MIRLGFSRLRLALLTALDLGLVSLAALGIQDGRALLAAPSFLLLAFSATALLLISREWFSPSYINIGKDALAVKWNNWRLGGARLGAALTKARPRSLELRVGGPVPSLDPVGPLHLAAMFLVLPLLRPFLPLHLARLYYLDSRTLMKILGADGGQAVVRFPAALFGARRIRHALEESLE